MYQLGLGWGRRKWKEVLGVKSGGDVYELVQEGDEEEGISNNNS